MTSVNVVESRKEEIIVRLQGALQELYKYSTPPLALIKEIEEIEEEAKCVLTAEER